jgi:hypothetical protein
MFKRSSVFAALGVVLGLSAGAASVHGWTTANRLTYLTFSGPVALPGVILNAGTYAFELADGGGTSNLVLVRNKNLSHVYFLGFTERVDRPASIKAGSSVSLAEARHGEAPSIVAWYPPDTRDGLKFIYPRR